MDEYVYNIVGDVKRLIKENGFPSPRAALDELMTRAFNIGAVEPRVWEVDAQDFVQRALGGDDELQDCAKELDCDVFKDAVLYNFWCRLDAELYRLVCKAKEKEILKKGNENEDDRSSNL